jgi:hypothetical protein
MLYRNKKLLTAARDQACVLCGSVGTTVACHANSVELGKGMGIKAPDYYTAWLCQRCHNQLDGRSGRLMQCDMKEMWTRAYLRTVAQWFEQGIVVVK